MLRNITAKTLPPRTTPPKASAHQDYDDPPRKVGST